MFTAYLPVFLMLGVALLVPCILHGLELLHIDDPGRRRIALRTVGFRELGTSAVFSTLAVYALW